MSKDSKGTINLLFEVGILAKTPRSGFHFLGSGQQSVAEHVHRVVYVGWVLATLEGADVAKVMKMCLLHDLAEARTSDLNYVHQKYAHSDEEAAIQDLAQTLTFGNEMIEVLNELKERKTKEALITKDADQIEWLLSLKEQVDIGNSRAATWIPSAVKRLKTEKAQVMAGEILQTDSDSWWFSDKESDWWVNRDKKSTNKRF